jgi:hypothetical protein
MVKAIAEEAGVKCLPFFGYGILDGDLDSVFVAVTFLFIALTRRRSSISLPATGAGAGLAVQARGARNQLVPSLPDDVDQIVAYRGGRAKIRERVAGTALERVSTSSAWLRVLMNVAAQPIATTRKRLRRAAAGIYVDDSGAPGAGPARGVTRGAGDSRCTWRASAGTDAPWSTRNFSTHRAAQWGSGEPAPVRATPSRRASAASPGREPLPRGLACDVFANDFGKTTGGRSGAVVGAVLADELTHVRSGSDWCAVDARRPERAAPRGSARRRPAPRAGGARATRARVTRAGFPGGARRALAPRAAGWREPTAPRGRGWRERHLARRAARSRGGRGASAPLSRARLPREHVARSRAAPNVFAEGRAR